MATPEPPVRFGALSCFQGVCRGRMANIKFFEAVLNNELPISKAWAENGWPQLLYPYFLACCQFQHSNKNARKAFTLAMGQDIKTGKLQAAMQRISWFIEDNIIEPHVTAPDFAAWLVEQEIDPSPLVAEWIKETGGAAHQAKPQEEKPLGATAPAWMANKPQRSSGYNWSLYRTLSEACRAGLPRPTARNVLEQWRINKPDDIAEVLPNGFRYAYKRGKRFVDMDGLRNAIDRMTTPPDKRPISAR